LNLAFNSLICFLDSLISAFVMSLSETLSLDDTIQANNGKHSITLSETLSLDDTTIQANNGKHSITLPETLSLDDTILDQSNNTTNFEVNPKLISIKPSYLITEEVEFEFEFYNSTEILVDEKQKLENATDIINDQLEASLIETESILETSPAASNSTSTITEIISDIENIFSIPMVDAATMNDSDITKAEIKESRKQIKELKAKFNELSASDELDDKELKEIKKELKSVIKQIKTTFLIFYYTCITR